MILISLVLLASSEIILEYRLSENYGQIIYDYSLNQRHAINGFNESIDSKDCLSTDRGLYFKDNYSALRFPINTYSNLVEHLSIPYEMIFWMNIQPGSGRIAFRYTINSSWYLYLNNNILEIAVMKNENYTKISNGGILSYLGSWALYSVIVYTQTLQININQKFYQNYLHDQNYIEDGYLHTCGIGSDIDSENSVNGFLWYAAILIGEDSSQYMYFGYSDLCLSGNFCNCTPAIKINGVIGCVSSNSNITENSDGDVCKISSCNGGILNDCNCNSNSCLKVSTIGCSCLEMTPSEQIVCICPDGMNCCNHRCESCKFSNLCTKCFDPNAFIADDGLCYCQDGYYGIESLNNIHTCYPCHKDCLKCDTSDICIKC